MVTVKSLKHYDEKSKNLISQKQDSLKGTKDQIVSFDEEGKVISKDFSEGADKITYSNEKYEHLTDVGLVLDNLLEKVYYVKPTCLLFAEPAGGTFETGTIISAPIVFNWEVNKDINMQTLTDCLIENENIRTATYNENITEDKTFILSVSDGENEATDSISYKFVDNIFWGSNEIPVEYNSDFINSLANKKLTKSIKGAYSFEINENEYGFWAVPSDIKISSIWIGGFEVTVDFVKEILYTNSQGHTREYNIYKTTKSGLGSFSAEIK
jgi:hypothetical protein